MKKSLFAISAMAVLSLGGLLQAESAFAVSIGGPSCATCQGATYTLSYSGSALPDADLSTETFRITLTIDTSTYNGGGGFIDAVAIKVSNSVVSSTLIDAPIGLSNWNLVPGGISAGGCSGSGSGFDCADWVTADPKGAAVGGTLSWTFDQKVKNGALFPDLLGSSIKARYVDANGNKVGALVSETAVPEPASLLLLGAGLVGLGIWRRKFAEA